MIHDPLSNPCLLLTYIGAHCGNHAARFMAGNHRFAATAQTNGCSPSLGTVGVQVTTAHARGFDRQHYLTRTGYGVRKLAQF
jgi:hypothetical protein